MHLFFEFPKDEFGWNLLSGRTQYLVHISENLHESKSFEPLPRYLSVRASKSTTNKVDVPSDPLPSSHQIGLVPQVEVGEIQNSFVDLPPSSPTNLNVNLKIF